LPLIHPKPMASPGSVVTVLRSSRLETSFSLCFSYGVLRSESLMGVRSTLRVSRLVVVFHSFPLLDARSPSRDLVGLSRELSRQFPRSGVITSGNDPSGVAPLVFD